MRMPQVRFDTIRMAGGWDEMTPILSLGNGVIRDSVNFESAVTGGYTRVRKSLQVLIHRNRYS